MKLSDYLLWSIEMGEHRLPAPPLQCAELAPDNATMFCVLDAGHDRKHCDEEGFEW